jgi:hypothetical protein
MRRVALVLAAVLPLALAACGDSTGPGGGLAGTYELRTINGQALPFLVGEFPDLDLTEELTAGSVRLNANATFSASHTVRLTEGTQVTTFTTDINGTYSRSGNNVTLNFPDPDGIGSASIAAVWDGRRRLTITESGEAWVYER